LAVFFPGPFAVQWGTEGSRNFFLPTGFNEVTNLDLDFTLASPPASREPGRNEIENRVVNLSDAQQTTYTHDPDVQLMLRVKAGDQAAYSQLVAQYKDRLIVVFTHMLHDQDTAEDLAQEVFLRVYRSKDRYMPSAKFSTWLFRIANNLASNHRRNRGRRKEVPLDVRDSGTLSNRPEEQLLAEKSGMMPTRQADKRELQDVVRQALGTLNERQRLAVMLHKFEGMSYADIGQAMEMSVTAVKSLLSRARENLREALEQHVKR
jgi:RNA polymerase sigma-70 factor (ECF subfamily)